MAALAALLAGASPAAAQDVATMLRQQRLEARFAELLGERGLTLQPRGTQEIGNLQANLYLRAWQGILAERAAETARRARAEADSLARIVRLGEVAWVAVAADEQEGFLSRYRAVFWEAAASPQPLDTVATPMLRARLNTLFGAPTRNAAAQEQESYAGSEHVQFEYWLIANDSIPLLVLDLDGPFGRGLLIAGDERQRRLMPALKADLSARLLDEAVRPTPYVDYYHPADRDVWYRAGYDGTTFFAREARRPRWAAQPRQERKWIIHR